MNALQRGIADDDPAHHTLLELRTRELEKERLSGERDVFANSFGGLYARPFNRSQWPCCCQLLFLSRILNLYIFLSFLTSAKFKVQLFY